MAIRFDGQPNSMRGQFSAIPAFPGERFGIVIPEAIGDAGRTQWQNVIHPVWDEPVDGTWTSRARVEGVLSYAATVSCTDETADIWITLTNESQEHWEQTCAFTCFQVGAAPSIRDHDCLRHWTAEQGELRRLIELPRFFGPRPTIQLYSVEGAPPGRDIPFVANFRATPEVTVEPWLAVTSADESRLAAVVAKPALFLFQNMEYSCIHSCPTFGPLAPGESGRGLTRVYFVEGGVATWRERMMDEMAQVEV